ncbi:hypothetical protein [Acidithiobacillus sp.]|jgi:hypothetical protein|uniref:hypothetical protein n=1 Tax=Acidithiobacillus sp. TaxID=1872118 RepID=UPI0025BEF776|nr:hypothetical protein [Acidithiobacillus sp.]MCK9188450.1 hypothetical protein [Acidithiobacillus sp.]MCK9358871.1 hypothetical protein [Acidithiobacillus sp.]
MIAHANQPPFPPALVRYCDMKSTIAAETQKARRAHMFTPNRDMSLRDQVAASIIKYRMGSYTYIPGHKNHNGAIFIMETAFIIHTVNEVFKWESRRETTGQVHSLINMACLMGPSVRKYKHNHPIK